MNDSAVCRLTSNLFPWCTEYELEQLPDFPAIADELAFAGKLARAYDQRLTFHPSHFVKLAPETDELLAKSIKELEVHSQVCVLLASFIIHAMFLLSLSFLSFSCCTYTNGNMHALLFSYCSSF